MMVQCMPSLPAPQPRRSQHCIQELLQRVNRAARQQRWSLCAHIVGCTQNKQKQAHTADRATPKQPVVTNSKDNTRARRSIVHSTMTRAHACMCSCNLDPQKRTLLFVCGWPRVSTNMAVLAIHRASLCPWYLVVLRDGFCCRQQRDGVPEATLKHTRGEGPWTGGGRPAGGG